jgi:nucleotide-binding universal stress UspA family protein
MYSKILMAMDESELSRHALQQAIELAQSLSARLRVVHVIDMSWLPIGPEIAIDTTALSAARRSAGITLIAVACETARLAGIELEADLIETETPVQYVAEAIAGEAARWGADLLVMGTHGRRGFQHLMLGSVAERTLRRSLVPVLLIPPAKEMPTA